MYLDAGKALSEVSNTLPLRIRNVKKLIRDASFVIRSVSKGIHSRRNRIRCRVDNWSNAAKCMRDASSVIRSVSKGIHSRRNRIRWRIDNWRNAAKCMRDASSVTRSVSKGIHSARNRSEEHTSELQSRENLVCSLLLENKQR